MERFPPSAQRCIVCGFESPRHRGWYLVVENQWLDRIKILDWHPILARQAAMRSVCGEQHLKVLLTHWLTHANLRLMAGPPRESSEAEDSLKGESDTPYSAGKLIGELSVQRESLSRVWTGSRETLECILNELVHGSADRPVITASATLEQVPAASTELVLT